MVSLLSTSDPTNQPPISRNESLMKSSLVPLRPSLVALGAVVLLGCDATGSGARSGETQDTNGPDCDSCVRSICAPATLPPDQPIDFYTAVVLEIESGEITVELVRREGGRGTTSAAVGDVVSAFVGGVAASAQQSPLAVGDELVWKVLNNDDGTLQLWGEPYRLNEQGDPECSEGGIAEAGQFLKRFSTTVDHLIVTALSDDCRELLQASGVADGCSIDDAAP